jgi:hypothetical protein
VKLKNRYRVRFTTDVVYNWQSEPKATAQGVIYMVHGPSSVLIWSGPLHEIVTQDAELETEAAYRETTERLGKVFQELFKEIF